MKPSEKVKSAGLKSLAELAQLSGQSVQTINNWYKNKPRLFKLVLNGAVVEKRNTKMNTENKLTGEKVELDHYSDYFNDVVNGYCERLKKNIFQHNGYRIKVKDLDGTLKWYSMSKSEFDSSGLSYNYYELLDFVKIRNFLEVLTDVDQSESLFRDSEKGIDLFMKNLMEEWEDYKNNAE